MVVRQAPRNPLRPPVVRVVDEDHGLRLVPVNPLEIRDHRGSRPAHELILVLGHPHDVRGEPVPGIPNVKVRVGQPAWQVRLPRGPLLVHPDVHQRGPAPSLLDELERVQRVQVALVTLVERQQEPEGARGVPRGDEKANKPLPVPGDHLGVQKVVKSVQVVHPRVPLVNEVVVVVVAPSLAEVRLQEGGLLLPPRLDHGRVH